MVVVCVFVHPHIVLLPNRIGKHGRVFLEELHEDLVVAFLLVSSGAVGTV